MSIFSRISRRWAVVTIVLVVLVALLAVLFWPRRKPVPPTAGAKPQPPKRVPCSVKQARKYAVELARMADEEERRIWMQEGLQSRQAAWLMSKARYALFKNGFSDKGVEKKDNVLTEAGLFLLEDTYHIVLRGGHQSRYGLREIQEEKGSRLRAYISEIDQSVQTYSLSVPPMYDPNVQWPLVVSMHGHGWYAPFQGHPAPNYGGVFCLSPQGRGATDYKDLGEVDVMHVIEEVQRDFNIDPNRIYLTGSSMGGTGTFHLATRYADKFAAINPIVANADNEAWTKHWGWNRRFDGRYDTLRKWLQDDHTARAFVENLLQLPCFVVSGSADFVVPPDHSRNMVRLLRQYGANVQYREYPGCGHGGFPKEAMADALAWTCGWERNPYPRNIYWKANQVKYGKCHWLRMEQLERPLKTGVISANVLQDGNLNVQLFNVLAFSFQRPRKLFPKATAMTVTVNGRQVQLNTLPDDEESWIEVRNDPDHGWQDARLLQKNGLRKRCGLEGPVNEALQAPFMVVVGSSSSDPEINAAWLREAKSFAAEWKRRNGKECLMVLDSQCRIEDMQKRNIILFGGERDNSVSDLVAPSMPIADIMANVPSNDEDSPEGISDIGVSAPDVGSIILYPNVNYAPDKLVVMLSANSPEAAYQMWGRFGNWFNWGVFDSKKYFDYAVFDSRTVSPETYLVLGWYGTDWSVDNGSFFLGNETLRQKVAPQCHPPFDGIPAEGLDHILLAELMPKKIDQMRGALGIGRGFFGEELKEPGSLGMRAPCTVEYEIGGRFTKFTTGVTLLNSPETDMCQIRERGEAVKFTVFGDNRKLGEKTVTWKKPEEKLELNVTGVKVLKLVAAPAGGPAWLHSGSAWLGPRLD